MSAIIEVADLVKTFKTSRWPARPLHTTAIDHVSLDVKRGEILGIAGESGSGKSTLISAMCGLVGPDSGTVTVAGRPAYRDAKAGGRFDRELWRSVQLVNQDPYTALNPAMTVLQNVTEPLRCWGSKPDKQAAEAALELLAQVGLGSDIAERSPRGLSGGQLQRASIARALAADPEVVLLDEAVSALDVSIQAQILALLARLRTSHQLTYVLVSHNVSVLRLFCDRIVVMRHGAVVEECAAEKLTAESVTEDYTRRLLDAVPVLEGAT